MREIQKLSSQYRDKPSYWEVRRAVKASRTTISAAQLTEMFHKSPLRHLQLLCLDSRYVILDTHATGLVIAYNGVDLEKYESESYDCDNFAISLAGAIPIKWDCNNIGIVTDFSARHAYNCVPTTDNGIIVVEPQNDTLFLDYSPYPAKGGFVLFA